jgi:hypothetical protein
MPIPRDDRDRKPWPTAHVSSDGVVRNLAEYIADEWPDPVEYPDPRSKICWGGERSKIARSLGRKRLPEIMRMTNTDNSHGEPLCW